MKMNTVATFVLAMISVAASLVIERNGTSGEYSDHRGVENTMYVVQKYLHSPDGFHTDYLYKPTRIKFAATVGVHLQVQFYVAPTTCLHGSRITFEDYLKWCEPLGLADHVCIGKMLQFDGSDSTVSCTKLKKPEIQDEPQPGQTQVYEPTDDKPLRLIQEYLLSSVGFHDDYLYMVSKLRFASATGHYMTAQFTIQPTNCRHSALTTFTVKEFESRCSATGADSHYCQGRMHRDGSGKEADVRCKPVKTEGSLAPVDDAASQKAKTILEIIERYLHSSGMYYNDYFYKPTMLEFGDYYEGYVIVEYYVQPTNCSAWTSIPFETYQRDCTPIGAENYFCEGVMYPLDHYRTHIECEYHEKEPTALLPDLATSERTRRLLNLHLHSHEGFRLLRLYKVNTVHFAEKRAAYLYAEFTIQPTACYFDSGVGFSQFLLSCPPIGIADYLCTGTVHVVTAHDSKVVCKPISYERGVISEQGEKSDVTKLPSVSEVVQKYLFSSSKPHDTHRHTLVKVETAELTGTTVDVTFVTQRTSCLMTDEMTFSDYSLKCQGTQSGYHVCEGSMDLLDQSSSSIDCYPLESTSRLYGH